MCNDFKKRIFETNMLNDFNNYFIKGIYETPDTFAEFWWQRNFCMFFTVTYGMFFFFKRMYITFTGVHKIIQVRYHQ